MHKSVAFDGVEITVDYLQFFDVHTELQKIIRR